MLNPAVLKPLWRKQTSKWRELGEHHLNKIISLTADVATKIFEDICDRAEIPTKTKMTLADAITEFSEQSKKLVMLQLDDLCKARANMALQTTDPKFLERVREARMLRFKAALERYKKSSPAGNYVLQTKDQANQALSFDPEVNQQCMIVNSNSIELLFNEMHPYGTRTQNTEDEIHDLLKAYYEASPLPLPPLAVK
jgi:HD superfamily phosphohydrolase